jgi:hypothetical protein
MYQKPGNEKEARIITQRLKGLGTCEVEDTSNVWKIQIEWRPNNMKQTDKQTKPIWGRF